MTLSAQGRKLQALSHTLTLGSVALPFVAAVYVAVEFNSSVDLRGADALQFDDDSPENSISGVLFDGAQQQRPLLPCRSGCPCSTWMSTIQKAKRRSRSRIYALTNNSSSISRLGSWHSSEARKRTTGEEPQRSRRILPPPCGPTNPSARRYRSTAAVDLADRTTGSRRTHLGLPCATMGNEQCLQQANIDGCCAHQRPEQSPVTRKSKEGSKEATPNESAHAAVAGY